MPTFASPAVVLRFANYRDNDRMLTLLTPSGGRITAMCRGCRRPKSPLLPASELFATGEYLLVLKQDRAILTSCQVHDSFYPIRLDYDKLVYGSFFCALAETAAQPGEPCAALFHLLLEALSHLAYHETAPEALAAAFILHCARLMGYMPQLRHCVVCGETVSTSKPAYFCCEDGGVVCAHCYPHTSDATALTTGQLSWLLAGHSGEMTSHLHLPYSDAPFALMLGYIRVKTEKSFHQFAFPSI